MKKGRAVSSGRAESVCKPHRGRVCSARRVKDSEREGREATGAFSRQSGVITGVITVTAHCCATERGEGTLFLSGNPAGL